MNASTLILCLLAFTTLAGVYDLVMASVSVIMGDGFHIIFFSSMMVAQIVCSLSIYNSYVSIRDMGR